MQPSYVGFRWPDRCRVVAVDGSGAVRGLGPSLRSPRFPSEEWEWGYGGTGPAELAWALIHDATGDALVAHKLHQSLKWALVSRLNRQGWVVDLNDLLTLLVSLAEAEDVKEKGGMTAEQREAEEWETINLAPDGERKGNA